MATRQKKFEGILIDRDRNTKEGEITLFWRGRYVINLSIEERQP